MDKIKALKIITPIVFVITLLCYPLLYPVQPVTGISPDQWTVLVETLKVIPYAAWISFLIGLLWALFFAKKREDLCNGE